MEPVRPQWETGQNSRGGFAMMAFLKTFFAATVLGALVAGCGGGGGGGSSSNGVVVDNIPPSVVYTTPVNNEAGVGTNAKITVTFSEAVNPATVTKDTFRLVSTTTGEVTLNDADVTYDVSSKIATIAPSSLGASQEYTVIVNPNVVKDSTGNTMTDTYDWKFTTAAAADNSNPVLNSKAPADLATDVGINTVIAMSFSKPMDISTFGSAFTLKTSGLIPVPITGKFTLIGQVVVFTPDILLFTGTEYIATLTTNAKDLTGNQLAAQVTWSFTTGMGLDTDKPTVLSVSPINGATGVSRTADITVTFDKAVHPNILGKIDGYATDVTIDYTTNTVTMKPTNPLQALKVYPFAIQVKDLAGNLMASPYLWSFTTGN